MTSARLLTASLLLVSAGCELLMGEVGPPGSADAGQPGSSEDAGVPDSGPGATAGMVRIEAGLSAMGCLPAHDNVCGSYSDEKPAILDLFLSAYEIDRTEVTQDEYQRCVGGGACSAPGNSGCATYAPAAKPKHPVTCVTWDQADRFCRWAGKHLPTEAQWEKAARGSEGRAYPWGDGEPDCTLAQFELCTYQSGSTLEVASLPQGNSPSGAADLAGNAAEWVADWYSASAYSSAAKTDPQGPGAGTLRVVRGGGWESISTDLRASRRKGLDPNTVSASIGFRCAR